MKRIISLSILMVFALGMISLPSVFAEDPGIVMNAGNKYCPVGGEPVSGQDFVVIDGMRYGLCCAMCAKKFKADPEKYKANMLKQEPEMEEVLKLSASLAGDMHAMHGE